MYLAYICFAGLYLYVLVILWDIVNDTQDSINPKCIVVTLLFGWLIVSFSIILGLYRFIKRRK